MLQHVSHPWPSQAPPPCFGTMLVAVHMHLSVLPACLACSPCHCMCTAPVLPFAASTTPRRRASESSAGHPITTLAMNMDFYPRQYTTGASVTTIKKPQQPHCLFTRASHTTMLAHMHQQTCDHSHTATLLHHPSPEAPRDLHFRTLTALPPHTLFPRLYTPTTPLHLH
jgi:hypothetical protein